ncbi:hypothetical protein [Glaciecola sp. 1036]|uniref:hypothetical protein n=1 Tax=Alteromonadaceae TaxID=72275 RepID=UPI003D06C39C
MKNFQKYVVFSLATFVIFLSGALAGIFYKDFDMLCESPSPHVLLSDMISEEGIVFPKGTIVPLKSCAYRQRFDWEFAIDVSVNLEVAEDTSKSEYGFSVLEEVE